jgi:carboxymethylenebutenolidase
VLFALGCGDSADEEPAGSTATQAPPSPTTATGAATGPGVSANDPAVEASDVSFPGPASEMKGYLARPRQGSEFPGILVIHENRGLLDHFKDVARRYAKEGFVALAIDLVSRQGGTSDDATKNMTALRASLQDFLADLNSGVNYLKNLDYVRDSALGVTGFCFGGGYTWELALDNPEIKAAVPYYGTVSTASLERVPQTNAAILGIYGGTDARVTSQSTELSSRLQAAGKTFEIKVYDGAGHAFFNDTGGAYNQAAAADAWLQTLAWFRKYLTG